MPDTPGSFRLAYPTYPDGIDYPVPNRKCSMSGEKPYLDNLWRLVWLVLQIKSVENHPIIPPNVDIMPNVEKKTTGKIWPSEQNYDSSKSVVNMFIQKKTLPLEDPYIFSVFGKKLTHGDEKRKAPT